MIHGPRLPLFLKIAAERDLPLPNEERCLIRARIYPANGKPAPWSLVETSQGQETDCVSDSWCSPETWLVRRRAIPLWAISTASTPSKRAAPFCFPGPLFLPSRLPFVSLSLFQHRVGAKALCLSSTPPSKNSLIFPEQPSRPLLFRDTPHHRRAASLIFPSFGSHLKLILTSRHLFFASSKIPTFIHQPIEQYAALIPNSDTTSTHDAPSSAHIPCDLDTPQPQQP